MKKFYLSCIVLFNCMISWAQKPVGIESIAANYYEPEWYGEQMNAWQKIVDENPENQWAWRNLFRATYYYELFTTGFKQVEDSKTAKVLRNMEQRHPDSFVLNLSKCKFSLPGDSSAETGQCIYRAIDRMPEDATAEDINIIACRLWGVDSKNHKVDQLFTDVYKKGYYPERILHYNWNLLQSMQPNALYFGNGDNITAPMRMLQAALDLRRDVTVIPLSFLFLQDFRDALCEQLHIKPFPVKMDAYVERGAEWAKDFEGDFVMHLIKESKRPAYFFTDVLQQTNLNKDHLYNEGLLLKYSAKPYDNFAVAMHNVKSVYHLEYLTEPDLVYNTWQTSWRMDLNNVTLLAHLISKLRKKGDEITANRLYHTLDACVKVCRVQPEFKAKIESILKAEVQ